ncbi:MAG: M20/M25/M40 family metallo-hydrolase [Candidatus Dormibacteraceae bacterium]
MGLDQALELAQADREAAEREFFEELRIPSMSALSEHRADCRHNCEWLAERMRALGFTVSITDVVKGGNPVLQADWRGAGEEAPTVTLYGHYDVQPPDPLEEWVTPPFEPTVRDGFVYARGSSDNKNNHFAALKAAEYATRSGVGVNIRFLIEGEEEVSGEALPTYLAQNAGRLKSDYTLIWDGGFSPEDQPALSTGLRGMVYTEIHLRGAAQDLHSGQYGGVAPNPNNTLAHIISALKDRDGRITVPGYYDKVKAPDAAETADWNRSPAFTEQLLKLTGAPALEGEGEFAPVERTSQRPTLDVNGMIGGFTGEGSKTVIPAHAMAKISMRLVPDQDPEEVFAAFETYVRSLTTPGVTVEVKRLGSAPPVLLDYRSRSTRALQAAFEASFGERAILERSGGSVPVSVAFAEHVGGEIVCSGLSQAGAGPHGPNEHFRLDNLPRGVATLLRFLFALAER